MAEIQEEIKRLQGKLTGDMFKDMDVKHRIHKLEMKMNGVKPNDSHFECVGCSA